MCCEKNGAKCSWSGATCEVENSICADEQAACGSFDPPFVGKMDHCICRDGKHCSLTLVEVCTDALVRGCRTVTAGCSCSGDYNLRPVGEKIVCTSDSDPC